MRKLLFLLFLLASPLAAFAQGMRYDNFVLKPLAAGGVTPVSGALITVCTSAGTGTPCTPKVANIYSDEALTTPITGTGGAGTTNSDANGNFGFYLTPGSYIVTVTGSGFTSYTIKLVLPVGSATASNLTGCLQNSVAFIGGGCALFWGNGDIGAQANTAYAQLPGNGGTIQVITQNTDPTYSFSTQMLFNTLGKVVKLDLGQAILNYTPTGGTSAAITAISESGNTVTATSTLNPGTGVTVCVSGYTSPADQYNGCFTTVSSNASQFTYANAITGLAGGGAGTAKNISPPAIVLDFGSATGSTYNYGGVINGQLGNAACGTIGGCANATVGIRVGSTGGAGQLTFDRLKITGFGIGKQVTNTQGWGANDLNCAYQYNTFGYQNTVSMETANFMGCLFSSNTRAADLNIAASKFTHTHLDSNTVAAVTSNSPLGSTITFTGMHFENFVSGGCSGGTTHYYIGNSNLQLIGGDALDDCTSGSTDFWFSPYGGATAYVDGTTVATSGRTVTNLVVFSQTGEAHFVVNNAGFGASPAPCPAASITVICSATFVPGGITPFLGVPKLTAGRSAAAVTPFINVNYTSATDQAYGLTNTAGGGGTWAWGDGIGAAAGDYGFYNGSLRATIKGTGSLLLPSVAASTTAQVAGAVVPITCLTSQKSESAADANVLTCAVPAVAGSYRIRFVLSVSAANTATLGWTANWTDSNGTAQTPTNMSLFQTGVAAPALTFTTSAAGNYYADAQIDVNNGAANIVVKLTFSGTSFTAKATATVERII